MKEHNPEIVKALENIAKIAEVEQDNNVFIMVNALLGSIGTGTDYLLATHIQKYLREVIMPMVLDNKKFRNISPN
jgi:hypothetical protein